MSKRFYRKMAVCALMVACLVPRMAGAEEAFLPTAEEAVAAITAGWNLGNTLDPRGDWIRKGAPRNHETAWGNPVTTPQMISAVKEAGFNAVRVPVTWSDHMDEEGNVNIAWMDRVQEVVDYVISQDMYCIINAHHDGGDGGWISASTASFEKNRARYAFLWTQIAERFRDYDGRLMFEAANEVLNDNCDWWTTEKDAYDGLNLYAQLFVDTVRAAGGNNAGRNLIVMTYAAAHGDVMYENLNIPEDSAPNHIIMEIHNYDPVGFTWTEASWTTMRDTWGTSADYLEVQNCMEKLAFYAREKGVPAIIGEYGVNYKDNTPEIVKYVTAFVGCAAEKGIKCFWWDAGDMALLDRQKAEIKHPEIAVAIVAAASR